MTDNHLILTVADHEANGFIALARFNMPRAFCEAAIQVVNGLIEPGSCDRGNDAFNFILDMWDDGGTVGESDTLPLQMAMRLAPDQVQAWLNERPDPEVEYWKRTKCRCWTGLLRGNSHDRPPYRQAPVGG